jgi:hypothetical protein
MATVVRRCTKAVGARSTVFQILLNGHCTCLRLRKVAKSTRNPNTEYQILRNLKRYYLSQYSADHHFPDNLSFPQVITKNVLDSPCLDQEWPTYRE